MRKKILYPFLISVNFGALLLQLALSQRLGFAVHAPLMTLFLPIIFLFNCGFFIYWIIRFRWPFLLFFGMLLLSYNQLGLLYQRASPRIETSPGIEVMSYNVRLFNRYGWLSNTDIAQEIENFIQRKFPHVLCFQEFSQTAAPRLQSFPHRFSTDGLAVYSRYPILNQGKVIGGDQSVAAIYTDIEYQGDTLRVYNMHMESFRLNHQTDSLLDTDQTLRLRKRLLTALDRQQQQLEALVAFDQKNTIPSLVCVDLNNNAFSEVYQGLASRWIDVYTQKGSGLGATYSLAGIPMRIDFIFADSQMKILHFERFREQFSDHQPIMARLQIP